MRTYDDVQVDFIREDGAVLYSRTMRTYNVHVDFISKEGAVLYSRTYPIIAESALMAETWVANILAVLEYQNFRFRETREANEH